MLKPKRPEIGSWKLNMAKNGSGPRPDVTFDILFDKYSKQKTKIVTSDRPLKKDEVTHTSREAILAS
jgi:hypothetical protein